VYVHSTVHLPGSDPRLQYWRRLFALDSQLTWFEQQNLLDLGDWMRRKHSSALDRRISAKIRLQESGVPLATLECEWKAQIEAQLVSSSRMYTIYISRRHFLMFMSGQSNNIANRAIAQIIEKQDGLKKLKQKLSREKSSLERRAGVATTEEIVAAEAEIDSLTAMITRIKSSIDMLISDLGVPEKTQLHKLKQNAFLRLRMNALALRQRIVQNLVARKFEMVRIERPARCGDRMGTYCPRGFSFKVF
jgi:hypothetical protein